ncbi:U3 small nucleolar ribonucleoprotein IMP3 (macronuclear) [Tetrahymena thermophila SB210]|uniref:U3 small nucleolar ribonucleoprotein protein IMP3 n=1 Tax=Tetrahymena thermophila (strain SB210) TaxID=312017 RepID=W7XL30_TETTS|nr:U3 small nucleolar ribonucleoprotein IMP3 [Tetrahymena thermophila SB210]EWS75574.1 U3 small nucleolar ribonucleoprotein IMP3 [Tetrahymena thermophila SB210]|eukprot:XP_012651874.1 U3 small nucleolar ribonucleoprotein IMP3 [Tetrahymena thermophila SB210]
MRKLKFHEQKLLKKHDFFKNWTGEDNHHEVKVIKRYHIQNREDYERYNKICGLVTSLICKLKLLDEKDQFRVKLTEQLLEKLYNLGLVNQRENVMAAEKLTVSAFCRRRLPVVMQINKFAQTVKEAVTYIEQGNVRIGPEKITDPAFLVSRNLEDHIEWMDQSKIKKKILEYKDKMDDYDIQE